MSFGIEGTTAAVVTLALDAATMRQQAIAANIANVNTPGYRPVRVRFFFGPGSGVLSNLRFFLYSDSDAM